MPRTPKNGKNNKKTGKPNSQSAKGSRTPENSQPKQKKEPKKKSQKSHFYLQIIEKPKPSRAFKMSIARKRFLRAYEETFGNVSASCEFAGISRRTYYRWLKSKSRVNRKFREKLDLIQPVERELDFTHAMLMKRIAAGDTTAITFNMKNKGRQRGYVERKEIVQIEDELTQLKKKISDRAKQRGVSFTEELALYLEVFPDLKPEIRQELTSDLIQ